MIYTYFLSLNISQILNVEFFSDFLNFRICYCVFETGCGIMKSYCFRSINIYIRHVYPCFVEVLFFWGGGVDFNLEQSRDQIILVG
jgi:hypothetical protein